MIDKIHIMFQKNNQGDDFENPWDTSANEDTQKRKKRYANKPLNNNSYLVDFLFKMFRQNKGSGGGGNNNNGISWKELLIFSCVGVGIIWMITCIYFVQEGELGVVLRFGKMMRIEPPGIHVCYPYPVEHVIVRRVDVVNKIDSTDQNNIYGSSRVYKTNTYSADYTENFSSYSDESSLEQRFVLTNDENIVDVDYIIFWKIKDVALFLFTARSPEMTVRVAAESIVREVFGQTIARLTLTEGRGKISDTIQKLLQQVLDSYKIGIEITSVQLQRVEPPKQVIQAFNDVQASLVDAERVRNDAEGYRNDTLPRANGEAMKVMQEAEAKKLSLILRAEGESKQFDAVHASYLTNPDVIRKKIYYDTMLKVFGETKKTILHKNISGNLLPHLKIGENLEKLNLPSGKSENKQ
ncbi:MAG: FtsH protease activity modulator HflK [Alphaproteobacteria bacterium]